jgi:hypothetical protein
MRLIALDAGSVAAILEPVYGVVFESSIRRSPDAGSVAALLEPAYGGYFRKSNSDMPCTLM